MFLRGERATLDEVGGLIFEYLLKINLDLSYFLYYRLSRVFVLVEFLLTFIVFFFLFFAWNFPLFTSCVLGLCPFCAFSLIEFYYFFFFNWLIKTVLEQEHMELEKRYRELTDLLVTWAQNCSPLIWLLDDFTYPILFWVFFCLNFIYYSVLQTNTVRSHG